MHPLNSTTLTSKTRKVGGGVSPRGGLEEEAVLFLPDLLFGQQDLQVWRMHPLNPTTRITANTLTPLLWSAVKLEAPKLGAGSLQREKAS